METVILDGTALAKKIEHEIKGKIAHFKRKPCLTVVLVGNHPASKIYVNRKDLACKRVGIESRLLHLDEGISKEELNGVIQKLNKDHHVDGILVQLRCRSSCRPSRPPHG